LLLLPTKSLTMKSVKAIQFMSTDLNGVFPPFLFYLEKRGTDHGSMRRAALPNTGAGLC